MKASPQEEIDPADLVFGDKVGSGSTADTFQATWQGHTVAVKKFTLNGSQRHSSAKEMLVLSREMSINAKVNHPNLVKCYGAVLHQRPYCIISEFCEGGTCYDLLHNCPHIELTWAQSRKMMTDIAAAVDYLHTLPTPIIHRDLKSTNLLLEKVINSEVDIPIVKVADYGLCRIMDEDVETWGTMTREVGTVRWMAPEVFCGGNYNEKADVFSYAMCSFEVVCRELPFEEEEPGSLRQLIVRGHRPDMDAVPPDCPAALKQVMITCWVHEPSSRPSFRDILVTLSEDEVTPGDLVRS